LELALTVFFKDLIDAGVGRSVTTGASWNLADETHTLKKNGGVQAEIGRVGDRNFDVVGAGLQLSTGRQHQSQSIHLGVQAQSR
jgi:hypothetical protein